LKSRQLHDGGVKHKINVDLFHKKKRDEKLYGARSEREVQQQLAEIERAAQEALATDKREHGHLFFQVTIEKINMYYWCKCNADTVRHQLIIRKLQRGHQDRHLHLHHPDHPLA
jgi:ribosomal protein L9